MGVLIFELSLTFYFAATIVSVIELFKGSKVTSRFIIISAALGFTAQTASIVFRYISAGSLPVTTMHDAASFFSWCIVLIFFVLEYRYKLNLLGPFTMPIVFVLMLSSSILPREIKPLSPVLQSYWFIVHIVLAFLGNAAFAMAFGTGLMYLIQERHLKSKHLGGLFQRLPSIQILDEVNYKLISLGFPLLTLAIISGALWAENAWGSYWRWDPKEVWSLITWFIYALVIHARLTARWRGRRAAILSIVGFMSVIFTFFGVNLLLKGLHLFE